MSLNSLLLGVGRKFANYGAAPTSARTAPFMAPASMPDANSGMYDQPDENQGEAPSPEPEPAPAPTPSLPPPSQQSLNGPPGPPPLKSLEQPPPSASQLAPPPPKPQTAREQELALQAPKSGGIGRQLASAALNLIPGVNTTDIPRDVAYPGISDYLRKRQLLKDQAALEHQASQEDLTRMQREAYRENIESSRDSRKQNADTRAKTEQSNEMKALGPWAEPVDDPNLPPGIAPLLSPEEQGKYVLRQAAGQWFKVPTRTEQLRLEADSKLVDVPQHLQAQLGKRADLKDIVAAGKNPNLKFEHFTDENTGDVTTIGFDPATGAEKTRSTVKGVAKKRPPQGQQPPQALMIGPDGKAIVVRPGTTVPEGSRTAAGINAAGQQTAQNRSRSEFAQTVTERVPDLLSQVDSLKSKIGPGSGRWNRMWVNGAGMNDPDFASLDQDLKMYASAIVVTHFGARGGQQYREQLEKNFSQAQSPEDLKARIQTADKWVKGYANMGKSKVAGRGGPAPVDDSAIRTRAREIAVREGKDASKLNPQQVQQYFQKAKAELGQ